MNILLIEDDRALGDVTAELLSSEGYSVQLASTPQAAIDALSGPHAYCALLLDLQLGNDRGEALVRQLRGSGSFLPPMVLFSAQPVGELRAAAKEVGAVAILQKPCRIGQMLAAIASAIRDEH